jgi:hypothetical protein
VPRHLHAHTCTHTSSNTSSRCHTQTRPCLFVCTQKSLSLSLHLSVACAPLQVLVSREALGRVQLQHVRHHGPYMYILNPAPPSTHTHTHTHICTPQLVVFLQRVRMGDALDEVGLRGMVAGAVAQQLGQVEEGRRFHKQLCNHTTHREDVHRRRHRTLLPNPCTHRECHASMRTGAGAAVGGRGKAPVVSVYVWMHTVQTPS